MYKIIFTSQHTGNMVYFSTSHGARGITALFENLQSAVSEMKVRPFTVVRSQSNQEIDYSLFSFISNV